MIDLERQLRTLQLRRDIIRTLHQRRLEAGREIRELGAAPLRGRVMKSGHHDELGGSSWVIVRDAQGVEHFARLKFGQSAPRVGRGIELIPTKQGAEVKGIGRSTELGR